MKALCLLPLLFAVLPARAATVAVISGIPPVTVRELSGSFVNPVITTVRVGFFLNLNTAGLEGCDPRPALAANFVPLGEAGSPAGYGTPANNTLRINPANFSVTGTITDLTFGTGTPNTLENGFLARGTRLFLLINAHSSLPDDYGIFSATTWLVPTSAAVQTAALQLAHLDTPAEVIRGQLGFNELIIGSLCPEPGMASFALLAGAVLAGRRRR